MSKKFKIDVNERVYFGITFLKMLKLVNLLEFGVSHDITYIPILPFQGICSTKLTSLSIPRFTTSLLPVKSKTTENSIWTIKDTLACIRMKYLNNFTFLEYHITFCFPFPAQFRNRQLWEKFTIPLGDLIGASGG